MKTIYIPKGETVTYESVATEHLIVDGCLKVAYNIKAKQIGGTGVIEAGGVSADVICIDHLEADIITCDRLIAKRVEAPEVFVSESAAVSCFFTAAYVETGKLTVSISEIDEVKADKVINLTHKKRSLFGTLFASALRGIWLRMTAPKLPVVDADYQQLEPTAEESAASEAEQCVVEVPELQVDAPAVLHEVEPPVDEELNRFINMFKLARDSKFTLRIIPGTPEENAPVFDFETGTILRPVA